MALYSALFHPVDLSATASGSNPIRGQHFYVAGYIPVNNEALERLSRKSSHAYKPEKGGDK